MASAEDRRIRALRPAKPVVDPWHPLDVLVEEERLPGGDRVTSVAVFLAGRECPFTCVFCDLWRYTLDGPTPPGAIPAQLGEALDQASPQLPGLNRPSRVHVKLYNASNFFDDGAVPKADDDEILRLLEPFEQVVVECHPRLVARRALDFGQRLNGRLQVGLGLETVHPDALPKLNKKASLEDFDRAARTLKESGLGLRAFVLIAAPFVPPKESLDWTLRSVSHALECGAEHVAIIPVRTGNGEMDRLERLGAYTSPTLAQVEDVFDRCLELGPGVVTVDLWDLERFAVCPSCQSERIARLARLNLSGLAEPRIRCSADCPGL